MIVNEADGIARINLISRSGTPTETDVYAVVASEVVQQGDQLGAAFANLISRLSDDANPVPELYLDVGTPTTRIGTLRLLHGTVAALPSSAEHGEVYVATNGAFYTANSSGAWVPHATSADVATVQAALTRHINNTNNPHNVTTTQIGAATAQSLTNHLNADNPHINSASTSALASTNQTLTTHINAANPHSGSASTAALNQTNENVTTLTNRVNNHINNTSNPHNVTTGQINALNTTQSGAQTVTSQVGFNSRVDVGGTLNVTGPTNTNGALNANGNATFANGLTSNGIIAVDTGSAGRAMTFTAGGTAITFDILTGVSTTTLRSAVGGFTFRDTSGNYTACYASEFTPSSDRKLKSEIEDFPQELVDEFLEADPHKYEISGEEALGYIADELPEELTVEMDEDGTRGVKLYSLVATQGAVIKRQQEAIERLTATVEELSQRLDKLEDK